MATKKKATDSGLGAFASEIDIEATKQLLDEINAPSQGLPWLKLETSETKYIPNLVRVCPKRPKWKHPYEIRPVHYLGAAPSRMVLCPKEMGTGECPVCMQSWAFYEADEKKAAGKLRFKFRTFLNVVKINKDGSLAEEKVYVMGLNQMQFSGKRDAKFDWDEEGDLPLFEFFKKYGDLSHVETGRNLIIKAKQDASNSEYKNTILMKFVVDVPSPFPGTVELLEEGLTTLSEVAASVEPVEMVALLEGRATNAMVLPAGSEQQALAQPAPAPAEPKSAFAAAADGDEDEAPPSAPKTDPSEAQEKLREQGNGAMERLKKMQQNEE